jgi:hypothetical protein
MVTSEQDLQLGEAFEGETEFVHKLIVIGYICLHCDCNSLSKLSLPS